MATRKQIIIGTAAVLLVGTGVYVWHRKKKTKRKTLIAQEAVFALPAKCNVSQWTQQDQEAVAQDIVNAVQKAPAWTTISEAREVSFGIVRKLFKKYCPDQPVPSKRYQVDQYLESEDDNWVTLWTLLTNRVWFALTGSSEASH